jgi:hypothetical protein
MGFGLEISFIDHFNKRLVKTFNYGTIAIVHTLQMITPHATSYESAVISSVVHR